MRASLVFSKQPESSNGITPESYRWALCEDFRRAINDHREEHVSPSTTICVDESISKWYGLGGSWLDVGLPFYVSLERKPESGGELHTSACGTAGIMLRMQFAKSIDERDRFVEAEATNYGTEVALDLCAPWTGTSRVVVGDSFFSSVETAKKMYRNGLRYIGVVKTASRGFPMSFLSTQPMCGRGSHKTTVSKISDDSENRFEMMALCWVDRNRRYFISTASTSRPGPVQQRVRWRNNTRDGSHQQVLSIEIPEVAHLYYSAAGKVDSHNRYRQGDLNMEGTFEVKEWSFRINTTMLSMCVVDSYLLYKHAQGARFSSSPADFYAELAHQLCENTFDEHGPLHTTQLPSENENVFNNVSEEDNITNRIPVLIENAGRRRTKEGIVRDKHKKQMRCKKCKAKTKWICSVCKAREHKDIFICQSKGTGSCFAHHVNDEHMK